MPKILSSRTLHLLLALTQCERTLDDTLCARTVCCSSGVVVEREAGAGESEFLLRVLLVSSVLSLSHQTSKNSRENHRQRQRERERARDEEWMDVGWRGEEDVQDATEA